jgi:hypothetical protein
MEKHRPTLLEHLNELVQRNKHYQTILEDGIVTDAEISKQEANVEKLMADLDATLSDKDFEKITELMAELTVLYIVVGNHNSKKDAK